MNDDAPLEFEIEADSNYAGEVWFTVWHNPCGQYVIEDYARRMNAGIGELNNLCAEHLAKCTG